MKPPFHFLALTRDKYHHVHGVNVLKTLLRVTRKFVLMFYTFNVVFKRTAEEALTVNMKCKSLKSFVKDRAFEVAFVYSPLRSKINRKK